jgi:2-polyprenyl-6-methoxyphenol hydroxylase-like FAD-dependent oxidoreductase
MREVRNPDVLIAGAGAAGLTLAIDLARRGVAVRLIDKADGPFPGSRGKGIQPRSQEVFEDLGVLDRMAAIGGPYPALRMHQAGGGFIDTAVVEGRAPTPAEPYGTPLMLPQNLTEGVLRERLAEFGVAPQFGCELTGFDQDGEGVAARLVADGREETVRVRYLVGCDGGSSFVRRALDIGFPGETLPGRGLVADLALEGLDREAWHSWNTERLMDRIALCPLAGTDFFQLQGAIPEDLEDLSDAVLAQIIAERTGDAGLKLTAVRWRSPFRLNARLADRYRVGRVFLAGDAAHVHPPTGGQGLNTSLQDAYNLGWKLAAVLDGAPDALLDSYEAERRGVAAEVLGLSTRLLDEGRKGAEMRRGRENHEMDLGYFGSDLALDRRREPGELVAGARAPDAPCRGAAGQATRLFELFRGPQATLLAYETEALGIKARKGLAMRRIGANAEIEDVEGAIAAIYGLRSGDLVLVRPDGYVGAIVPAGEEAAMEAYLARLGLDA